MQVADGMVPVLAGSAISQRPADESRHRFYGGFYWAVRLWRLCGALRTLRPEFVRDAFVRYKITHVSLVPMVLKNLERGVPAKFEALSALKRFVLDYFIALNKSFTRARPNLKLSRRLLPQVHKAFGGEL